MNSAVRARVRGRLRPRVDYGFLQDARPFAVVEAIWAAVDFLRAGGA